MDELRKPQDPRNETTISLFVVSTATKPSTSRAIVLCHELAKHHTDTPNLRKVLHYSSACGLREGAVGVTKCAIELKRHPAFGVGIAISRSGILLIESEGSKILCTDAGRCKAEQAAKSNHERRE